MARANHKLVKRLMNEKRSHITDRQFFTSRMLAGHFEDMAAAQTRRYKYDRRVRVQLDWNPKSEEAAYTDNQKIYINTGNPYVTDERGRQNRYWMVCGLFAHELGHVLYTDFLTSQTHLNNLERGIWYPAPPALRTSSDFANEKALWAYTKADPRNLKAVRTVADYIGNLLEDGYIENRVLADFPGTLGYSLETIRKKQLDEMHTVTRLKELEDDGQSTVFQSILQVMLSYVKFREVKYGDEPLSDLRIKTTFDLIRELDQAVSDYSVKTRLDTVNLILVRCWEYIQEFCELLKKRTEEAEALAESIGKALGSMAGTTAAGTGGTPVAGSGSGSVSAVSHAEASDDAENEESEKEDDEPAGDDEEQEKLESDSNNGEDSTGFLTGSAGNEGKQPVSEGEDGRIPYHQTDSVSEPVGGTVERDEEYKRERYDKAASDIDRILDKMAEKAACGQLENERLSELNEVANNIAYGDIHKGVNISIKRITDVDPDLVEQYDNIAPRLVAISKQLQRSIIKQLKEHRQGGKQTGLMMGRRMDSHALCRNDGKVFYKNSLPTDIPELAVGLLLDESGSMGCSDRCTYARAAAIILHDFCDALEIPVMVYGHSTGSSSRGPTVELYSYAEFDAFDQDDRFRLMDVSARRNNRDGAALRFVAEQLSKRPEEVKLLILVSDGQPADCGYDGTAAEEDLRGIKQEYQRKGIAFVAAAIGDDKPSIQRIYGDSFLDITDLEQLPVKLTAMVKKHIRI
ncbi:cobaltochelatase CobT-related protein [Acutalibacter sp. 1XD8-36]|uniref:cobaltochelatase CobT-related protein n=1 Tax=Acutalibacter sp. 1XD8-36 TaxID=2320852 RepID=UPI0014136B62|nr:VWA domain-containing protein [Acutalibacter sp. 1XD8-36]NBJ90175.1 VWA domain-containing protein [Acutalibacter sp. 1XD8-36]